MIQTRRMFVFRVIPICIPILMPPEMEQKHHVRSEQSCSELRVVNENVAKPIQCKSKISK